MRLVCLSVVLEFWRKLQPMVKNEKMLLGVGPIARILDG